MFSEQRVSAADIRSCLRRSGGSDNRGSNSFWPADVDEGVVPADVDVTVTEGFDVGEDIIEIKTKPRTDEQQHQSHTRQAYSQ